MHRIVLLARRFAFAAGTVGFLCGLALMTWGAWPRPVGNPRGEAEAWVWIFLVSAQFGFWSCALPFQWHARHAVKEEFKLHLTAEIKVKFALALVVFLAPALLIARSVPTPPLAHGPVKMLVVHLVAVLAAVVAVEGIWYVKAALGDSRWDAATPGSGEASNKDRVKAYLLLRENLQRFILFLGAMISLGTLAKGASRHAYNAASDGAHANFPPEYVLLHGAYFTGLLALVYVPIYTQLLAVGDRILDSVFPIPETDEELRNLAGWQANRKSLEELLQLHTAALDNLRASLTILAPLASGAVSVLLGDKIMLDTK